LLRACEWPLVCRRSLSRGAKASLQFAVIRRRPHGVASVAVVALRSVTSMHKSTRVVRVVPRCGCFVCVFFFVFFYFFFFFFWFLICVFFYLFFIVFVFVFYFFLFFFKFFFSLFRRSSLTVFVVFFGSSTLARVAPGRSWGIRFLLFQ